MENVLNNAREKMYHTDTSKHSKNSLYKKIIYYAEDSTLLLTVIGFFMGRVSIMNMISPFGTSFLISAAATMGIKSASIIGIGIVAGSLTAGGTYKPVESVIALAAVFLSARIFKLNKKTSTFKVSFIAFSVNLTISLMYGLILNGAFVSLYVLLSLFDSSIVMALVYIYNYSIPVISERKRRKVLSNEEIICLSIICGAVISGLSNIYIFGIALKTVLSVFVITAAAYGQGPGVGAAIGTTIGIITCMSQSNAPQILSAYALAGMLSGIFKDMGKVGSGIGFMMGDMIIAFYLGNFRNVVNFTDLITGIFIFLIFPVSVLKKAIPYAGSSAEKFIEQQSYVERIKDIIRGRILHTADVFDELSKTLQDNEHTEKLREGSEISSVISSIVDRVCSNCEAKNICWKRDFYNTYQGVFQMVDVIQTDGRVDMDTVPDILKKNCLKVGQLIKAGNYVYELYRMNYKWRRKALEGKRVICEQIDGINGILKKLSDEIKKDIMFKNDVEEELAATLDKAGLLFEDIIVTRDENDKYEVNIYKKACLGKRECVKDICPAVSKVLNRKMKRDSRPCAIKEGTLICCFKLIEDVKYQVSTGISRVVKDEGGISGDNYSFLELNDGKYMMLLSDGMGTGPAAAIESNAAVSLLEKYLEAGFDKSTALKAINSAMVLRSQDDEYATIDLAVADLYTGDIEFIKIGAVSTFIKRENGTIETINSTTLPIGILNDVDLEIKKERLSDGDFVIMMTDGVLDVGGKVDTEWVIGILEEIKSKNPQEIANMIIEKAKERNKGGIPDDMTVMVSKIWQAL